MRCHLRRVGLEHPAATGQLAEVVVIIAIIVIVILEGSQGLVKGVPGDHLEHVHQPFVPTVQAHFVRTGSEFVCFVCFVVSVGAVPFLLPVFPVFLYSVVSDFRPGRVQGSRFKVCRPEEERQTE